MVSVSQKVVPWLIELFPGSLRLRVLPYSK